MVRVGGNSLPDRGPKGEFAQVPAGQIINRGFTHEEKDKRHHQECAEHKAQHPRRRHVVGQKACEQVAERRPTLLGQKHNGQDTTAVRIRGEELIGGVTGVQAQQPECAAGDQDDEA